MWKKLNRYFERSVRATKSAWRFEHFEPRLKPSLSLFRFSGSDITDESCLKGWILTSDQAYGGHSRGSWKWTADEGGYASLSGRLNMSIQGTELNRSGFCAVQSPELPTAALAGYHALLLRVRTHGRVFVVNVRPESPVNDDLYQCFLVDPDNYDYDPSVGLSSSQEESANEETSSEVRVDSDGQSSGAAASSSSASSSQLPSSSPPTSSSQEWTELLLPLEKFTLTWRGYVDGTQFPLEADRAKALGFLMAERQDGEFRLDVAWINALSKIQAEEFQQEQRNQNSTGATKRKKRYYFE